jgi:carnitine 3-dehydrogenase
MASMTGSTDAPALPDSPVMEARPVQRAAVIGTGVIGASWVTCFLARGLDVTAFDPQPGAETALRQTVAAQWPAMQLMGLAPDASPERLRFAASPEEAAADAQYIQENVPEQIETKRALFSRLDAAAPASAILATSSSTLTVSEFQDACAHHPQRLVLGHPFNPPHLIPLVEVGGGKATSAESVEAALRFYRAMGKHPIRLRREIRGHVANRLQAALWREAFYLAAEGVADIADIDAAIAEGPGLRWALHGPFTGLHLSGGEGGIGALFEKPLWQATEAIWRDLGELYVDRDLAARIARDLAGCDVASVQRERAAALPALLRLKAGMTARP